MIFEGEFMHSLSDNKEIIIEKLFIRLGDGSVIRCDYDTGEWIFSPRKTTFRLKGVYFDDEYANSKWEKFSDSIKEIFIEYGTYLGSLGSLVEGLRLVKLQVTDGSNLYIIGEDKLQRKDHVL